MRLALFEKKTLFLQSNLKSPFFIQGNDVRFGGNKQVLWKNFKLFLHEILI